jgi:hypothetical protein
MALTRNDENAAEFYSKTPRIKTLHNNSAAVAAAAAQTTTIRRALGDISNRKAAAPAAAAASSSLYAAPFSETRKKAAAASVKKPSHSVLLQPPPTQQQRTYTVPSTTSPSVKAASAKVSFHADQPPQDVVVVAPLAAVSKLAARHKHEIDDDDEATIEQSAGRLWIQQESLYDDDDHQDTDTLNVSLDGATTFRDEWNEALDFVHAQRVSEFWHDDEIDAQQERWARLQMDDDAQQQQQQLGFALYNDQGMATTRCALVSKLWRARACVYALFVGLAPTDTYTLLFHFCRLGFHLFEGLERQQRRRRHFVAGNDPGHQCSAPPVNLE